MSPEQHDDDVRRVLATLLAMQRQSWEQGVTGHALLDLGRTDLVRVLARDAMVRQTTAGKLAEIDDQGTVNCGAAGEVVRWLAEQDGDRTAAAALERQLHWLQVSCPRADDGTLFHLESSREVWTDTVYMVVPLLALVGDAEGALRQIAGHRVRLFDEERQLYAARWDEDTGRLTQGRFWGTGNGWVAAALARTLRHLGLADPLDQEATTDPSDGSVADLARLAAEHGRAVIDACLAHRRSDGLFHDVVDDPSTFVEANLAQMLAYATLTGAADGWLPTGYADTGRSLLESARQLVDRDGFVTQVCGAPHFDHQGVSAEAQSFFLLASAAARDPRLG